MLEMLNGDPERADVPFSTVSRLRLRRKQIAPADPAKRSPVGRLVGIAVLVLFALLIVAAILAG